MALSFAHWSRDPNTASVGYAIQWSICSVQTVLFRSIFYLFVLFHLEVILCEVEQWGITPLSALVSCKAAHLTWPRMPSANPFKNCWYNSASGFVRCHARGSPWLVRSIYFSGSFNSIQNDVAPGFKALTSYLLLLSTWISLEQC